MTQLKVKRMVSKGAGNKERGTELFALNKACYLIVHSLVPYNYITLIFLKNLEKSFFPITQCLGPTCLILTRIILPVRKSLVLPRTSKNISGSPLCWP